MEIMNEYACPDERFQPWEIKQFTIRLTAVARKPSVVSRTKILKIDTWIQSKYRAYNVAVMRLLLVKALSSLLVIAVMAPGCSTRSSREKGQQSGAAVQSQKDAKRLAIEKTARELIAATLGIELTKVQPQSRFIEDLGADELDTVEIIMRFEDEFGIVIPDQDAEKLRVVQQAYDYLVVHVPRWPKT
jgi:acyl carrier protein